MFNFLLKYQGLCPAALLLFSNFPALAVAPCTLTVTKITDLRFGSWVVVAGGTLTVSPSTGLRSGTANVVTPNQINSSVGPAQFKVTGSGNGERAYSLTLTIPNTVTSASSSMALSTAVASPDISLQRRTLCGSISETINVGATLQVGTSQTPGNYSSANTIVLSAQ